MKNSFHVSKNTRQKRYKAYLIGTNDEEKRIFKNSKCIVPVSVGQKYHEAGEFEAIIYMLNKHFAECTILVCDTLQKYSIAMIYPEKTESEIYDISKKEGDRWLERNLQYIKKLVIPYTISRWDEWFTNPDYNYYHKQVLDLYKHDSEYKEIVDQIVEEFLLRNSRKNIILNKAIWRNASKEYILEESATLCLWVKAGYKFDVYPTGTNAAMQQAYKRLLKSEIGIEYRSLSLNIKKVKQKKSLTQQEQELYKIIATDNILKHTPGHIYWKNNEGVFLGCNEEHAKYFGFKDSREIIGVTNFDILDKKSAIEITQADRKVLETDEEQVFEEKVGDSQYFLSKKIPLKNFKGETVGILGTSINITDKKKLEQNLKLQRQELMKALEAKEIFIRNINHEIRTPMQTILNAPQALKDNFYTITDEQKIYFIDNMLTATKRLMGLVDNLLDMSKFKNGEFVLNFKKENIKQLLNEIIEEFVMTHGHISINVPKNIPKVIKCDKMRIQQVFRNLLANSIKYGGKAKPILILLSRYKEQDMNFIKFIVKDKGIGIPLGERKYIFEPFVESTLTKKTSGGTGLGLCIAKEIVECHKGRIWVENLEQGEEGTKMLFIIKI